jgi:DNA-binding MarR family transcriptional regulator/GNAT superfamily N-acetyltransferase
MGQLDQPMIDQLRRFNRTVTQRVGALSDEFLARRRPLGQARLLWEIGADGCDLRLLRSRLDLDSGYLSRLLRSLEDDGLAVVERSKADGRVRTARLTASGLAERAELDRRADTVARRILRPLNGDQRKRLVAAMAEVERLLTASAIELKIADPGEPAARACMNAYFAELSHRFDHGFDPALSSPVQDAALRPPSGLLLLATLRGQAVGIGGLRFDGDRVAEVKRMWVAPIARGLGLGRRILTDLEGSAGQRGVRVLRLETNHALTEAIGLYKSAGYREVAPFNDEAYAQHWFEKVLGRPEAAGAAETVQSGQSRIEAGGARERFG